MTYQTAATLFSGGGGADIGLSDAGLSVKWGIEKDPDIVSVARENGLSIRQGDLTNEDPSEWPAVDVLHASPPCPNFSVAKTNAEESGEDVSLARATARFISGIRPQLFTLENVWGYRKSRSWQLIRQTLTAEGYDWNGWRLNCANWGVPQTRKRMIVAARLGGPRPKKPTPTHTENPQQGGLFGDDLEEWIGWHEAIEDLIPDLPETELADWQKERLPDELLETQLVEGTGNQWSSENASVTTELVNEPVGSIRAAHYKGMHRAVLVHGSDTRSCPQRDEDEASFSVIANGNEKGAGANVPRTVLVDGKPANFDGEVQSIENGPMVTVSANTPKHPPRAVLVDSQQTSRDATQKKESDPAMSVQAWHGRRPSHAPVAVTRRVVQMTPRCLARFQTFPDWYELPESKSLACRIIGNAVPPLAMKKWVSHWTE